MITRSIWRLASIAGLVISLCVVGNYTSAQIGAPEPINTPVKDQWQGPLEEFLRELRVQDRSAMVRKTSAFQIGGVRRPDSILFRIEDSSLCFEDLCFTVIGRVIDKKFVADAMFSAGKGFTRGDQMLPLFGFRVVTAPLIGEKVNVTLLETPNGWIVNSAPTLQR